MAEGEQRLAAAFWDIVERAHASNSAGNMRRDGAEPPMPPHDMGDPQSKKIVQQIYGVVVSVLANVEDMTLDAMVGKIHEIMKSRELLALLEPPAVDEAAQDEYNTSLKHAFRRAMTALYDTIESGNVMLTFVKALHDVLGYWEHYIALKETGDKDAYCNIWLREVVMRHAFDDGTYKVKDAEMICNSYGPQKRFSVFDAGKNARTTNPRIPGFAMKSKSFGIYEGEGMKNISATTANELKMRVAEFAPFMAEVMADPHAMIAGGLVLELMRFEAQECTSNHDIDVFVVGINNGGINDRIAKANLKLQGWANAIVMHVQDTMYHPPVVVYTSRAVTLQLFVLVPNDGWEERRVIKVQFITRLFKTPADCLINFDLGCCCVGLCAGSFYMTERAIWSIRQMHNVYDPVQQSGMSRLRKYLARSYMITLPMPKSRHQEVIRHLGAALMAWIDGRGFDIERSITRTLTGLGRLLFEYITSTNFLARSTWHAEENEPMVPCTTFYEPPPSAHYSNAWRYRKYIRVAWEDFSSPNPANGSKVATIKQRMQSHDQGENKGAWSVVHPGMRDHTAGYHFFNYYSIVNALRNVNNGDDVHPSEWDRVHYNELANQSDE